MRTFVVTDGHLSVLMNLAWTVAREHHDDAHYAEAANLWINSILAILAVHGPIVAEPTKLNDALCSMRTTRKKKNSTIDIVRRRIH